MSRKHGGRQWFPIELAVVADGLVRLEKLGPVFDGSKGDEFDEDIQINFWALNQGCLKVFDIPPHLYEPFDYF